MTNTKIAYYLNAVLLLCQKRHNKVCVQLPTHADNVVLPAFVRRTPLLQQSIDISCLLGPQQQTCSSRRTDTVPFHGPRPHAILVFIVKLTIPLIIVQLPKPDVRYFTNARLNGQRLFHHSLTAVSTNLCFRPLETSNQPRVAVFDSR